MKKHMDQKDVQVSASKHHRASVPKCMYAECSFTMRLPPLTVLTLREYLEDVFDKCIGRRRNHWCRSLWLPQEAKSSLCGIKSRKELAQIHGHSCYTDTITSISCAVSELSLHALVGSNSKK